MFSMAVPTVSFCQHPGDSLLYAPHNRFDIGDSGCNDAAETEAYTLYLGRTRVCSVMLLPNIQVPSQHKGIACEWN